MSDRRVAPVLVVLQQARGQQHCRKRWVRPPSSAACRGEGSTLGRASTRRRHRRVTPTLRPSRESMRNPSNFSTARSQGSISSPTIAAAAPSSLLRTRVRSRPRHGRLARRGAQPHIGELSRLCWLTVEPARSKIGLTARPSSKSSPPRPSPRISHATLTVALDLGALLPGVYEIGRNREGGQGWCGGVSTKEAPAG
jgi:hypothetical protein